MTTRTAVRSSLVQFILYRWAKKWKGNPPEFVNEWFAYLMSGIPFAEMARCGIAKHFTYSSFSRREINDKPIYVAGFVASLIVLKPENREMEMLLESIRQAVETEEVDADLLEGYALGLLLGAVLMGPAACQGSSSDIPDRNKILEERLWQCVLHAARRTEEKPFEGRIFRHGGELSNLIGSYAGANARDQANRLKLIERILKGTEPKEFDGLKACGMTHAIMCEMIHRTFNGMKPIGKLKAIQSQL